MITLRLSIRHTRIATFAAIATPPPTMPVTATARPVVKITPRQTALPMNRGCSAGRRNRRHNPAMRRPISGLTALILVMPDPQAATTAGRDTADQIVRAHRVVQVVARPAGDRRLTTAAAVDGARTWAAVTAVISPAARAAPRGRAPPGTRRRLRGLSGRKLRQCHAAPIPDVKRMAEADSRPDRTVLLHRHTMAAGRAGRPAADVRGRISFSR